MSNYPQDQRPQNQGFGVSQDRFGTRLPRDDNYGRRFSRDQAHDQEYDAGHHRGWQQEASHPRNFGSGDNYSSGENYGSDDYSHTANPEGMYERQEQANQNMPSYRSGRSQHRGEPWPRNEDRENYAALADNYENRSYQGRSHRYFDDEARAANRFARPQRFVQQNNNPGERNVPPSSYFSPSGADPRNAGNYNYAEPKYYGGNSGYGRDLDYAQNYSPDYSPHYPSNYSPNYATSSPRHSQGYGSWQGSSDVQGWQERDDAQIGAFGIQSHRGKGPHGYTRSDERIKEDVCERLSAHHYIDASAITVEVKDGVVTLEGNIDDRWQKYQAEDLIDATSGVKDINNRLMIKRAGQTGQRSDNTDTAKTTTPPTTRS